MLLEISYITSVSGFVGFFKRKSTKKIAEYIQNQLKEDMIHDQMTIKGYVRLRVISNKLLRLVVTGIRLKAMPVSYRALPVYEVAGGLLLYKVFIKIYDILILENFKK